MRGADLAVATDQRHEQSNNRCRHDAIRKATLLDKIRQFNEADGTYMNPFTFGRCLIESRGCFRGKALVARQLPSDCVSINSDCGHQASYRGKLFHFSR